MAIVIKLLLIIQGSLIPSSITITSNNYNSLNVCSPLLLQLKLKLSNLKLKETKQIILMKINSHIQINKRY